MRRELILDNKFHLHTRPVQRTIMTAETAVEELASSLEAVKLLPNVDAHQEPQPQSSEPADEEPAVEHPVSLFVGNVRYNTATINNNNNTITGRSHSTLAGRN
jgi:hypothetical protein